MDRRKKANDDRTKCVATTRYVAEPKQPPNDRMAGRGQVIVRRLRGSASVKLSTDEILVLTRE